MNYNFSLAPLAMHVAEMQLQATIQELRECNDISGAFGLALSETQMHSLAERRVDALRDTGRVEFDGGIFKKLVYAFCDSPYLSPRIYEETLSALQDSFYYYKSEAMERISDDELIEFMKLLFDGSAAGSLDFLAGTSLEELCRCARAGQSVQDVQSAQMRKKQQVAQDSGACEDEDER
ncbi:MAG: DUF6323 family protein [Ruthenibacterium sp.]